MRRAATAAARCQHWLTCTEKDQGKVIGWQEDLDDSSPAASIEKQGMPSGDVCDDVMCLL